MLWIIFGIAISYLLGSFPTAYIFGRLLKGIDIRKFGSGNVGATNALRVLGKGPGILVLILDILKGFITVICIANLIALKTTLISQDFLRIILGITCISGHNWTIFLGFKGGKGIATTFGVLIGLSIKIAGLKFILGLVVLTWFSVFLLLRMVSVASVIAGIALPIYAFMFKQSRIIIFFSILLCLFAIIKHRSNMKRVFQGKEPRTFFKKTS